MKTISTKPDPYAWELTWTPVFGEPGAVYTYSERTARRLFVALGRSRRNVLVTLTPPILAPIPGGS